VGTKCGRNSQAKSKRKQKKGQKFSRAGEDLSRFNNKNGDGTRVGYIIDQRRVVGLNQTIRGGGFQQKRNLVLVGKGGGVNEPAVLGYG